MREVKPDSPWRNSPVVRHLNEAHQRELDGSLYDPLGYYEHHKRMHRAETKGMKPHNHGVDWKKNG